MNFHNDFNEEYGSLVAALDPSDVLFKPKIYEFDMKNCESPPVKPYIYEAPKLELKALPPHLRYQFIGNGDTFLVITASDLNEQQVESLVKVLKRFKRATGWTIVDIIRIPPGICSHKIQLMANHKPSIDHKRRLNTLMQEVVKKEIFK